MSLGARMIADRLADPSWAGRGGFIATLGRPSPTSSDGETLYVDGAARLLSDATSPTCPRRRLMSALERRASVLRMLRSALDERSVFLWIGDENPQPELRSVSVVGANYGLGHRNLGSVGVVGPLRMDYATAIASVRGRRASCRATSRRSTTPSMPRDYYEVLGVGRDATEAEMKKRVPPPRPRAAPRRQRPRPRGGGEVQGGGGGLRGALRPRAAPHLRRLGHGPARRRLAAGAGFGSVEDIFQAFFGGRLRLRGAARADARPGPDPHGRDLRGRRDARRQDQDPQPRGRARDRAARRHPARHASSRCAATACRAPTAARPATWSIAVQVIVPSDLSEEQRELAEKLGETLEARNLRSRHGGERELLLPRAPSLRLIRLAVRCVPELAEQVLAELTVLAPERGRGGARAAATSSTRSTAARASCRSWVRSRRRRATAWSSWSRPRSPTTGPTAGRTSTSRSWSASGSGCAPPGRQPREGTIDLVVDPGRAFGTGAHPTTRLCLELLLELEAAGEASGPLTDLGTGSGVLAIAAAKLGWGPVRGYDHERPRSRRQPPTQLPTGSRRASSCLNLREGCPNSLRPSWPT